jgi:hypothetical protein
MLITHRDKVLIRFTAYIAARDCLGAFLAQFQVEIGEAQKIAGQRLTAETAAIQLGQAITANYFTVDGGSGGGWFPADRAVRVLIDAIIAENRAILIPDIAALNLLTANRTMQGSVGEGGYR